jgi:hypothetical protein
MIVDRIEYRMTNKECRMTRSNLFTSSFDIPCSIFDIPPTVAGYPPRRMQSVVFCLLIASFATVGALDAAETGARFPTVDALPTTEGLPDPFKRRDGTRVRSRAEWLEHRRSLIAMLEHYEYGHMPPAPDNLKAEEISSRELLDGLAVEKRLLISCGPKHAVKFRIGLTFPKGKGPFAVIFKNEASLGPHCPILEKLIRNGYVFGEYVRTELDLDENDNIGSAQEAYPEYDWGTIAVWAWGAMRLVDYLHTLDNVDKKRIAYTGHSRGGKTALLAAAFDERITFAIPNGSGAGGAGSYRVQGKKAESLDAITDPKRFSYWFHPRLRTFTGKENRLPFDQHFLEALVAPRALLVAEASGDLWANPFGTQQVYLAAKEVYEFLGAESRIGLHVREGKHDQLVEDWQAIFDFAELQFSDRKPEAGRRFDRMPFPQAKKAFEWSAPVGAPKNKTPQ